MLSIQIRHGLKALFQKINFEFLRTSFLLEIDLRLTLVSVCVNIAANSRKSVHILICSISNLSQKLLPSLLVRAVIVVTQGTASTS